MNVAEFFDADERRRGRDEFFGEDWRSHGDRRATYQVRWIEGTGEFYAMRQPRPAFMIGRSGIPVGRPLSNDDLTVELLGVRPDLASARDAMDGWESVMAHSDSLEWVRQRLGPPPPTSKSEWTDAFGEWQYRLAGCVYDSGCTFDTDGSIVVRPGTHVDLVIGPAGIGAVEAATPNVVLRHAWLEVRKVDLRAMPARHELRWLPHHHPASWCYLAIMLVDEGECRFKVPGRERDDLNPDLQRAVAQARGER